MVYFWCLHVFYLIYHADNAIAHSLATFFHICQTAFSLLAGRFEKMKKSCERVCSSTISMGERGKNRLFFNIFANEFSNLSNATSRHRGRPPGGARQSWNRGLNSAYQPCKKNVNFDENTKQILTKTSKYPYFDCIFDLVIKICGFCKVRQDRCRRLDRRAW